MLLLQAEIIFNMGIDKTHERETPGLQVHLQEMFQMFWDKKRIVQTHPLAFW